MYEYKILPLNKTSGPPIIEEIEDILNDLGADGWEIIGVNNNYIFLLLVVDEVDRLLEFVDA